MYILGITGGIATGKSSVLGYLESLGAPGTSADAISRDLLAPGTELTAAVLAEFPQCKASDENGKPAVDRRALSKTVFSDDGLRKKLDDLMHPPILKALQTFVDYWRSVPGKAAVVEIPLLFELDLHYLVDGALVVSCPEETQLERLMARHKLALPEAQRWIAAQWPLEKKRALADYVVDNGGDFSETQNRLKALWDAV